MTLTIPLGSWMLPASVTLFAALVMWLAYALDRSSGYGRGLPFMLAAIGCVPAVAIAWSVWAFTLIVR